MMHLSKSLKTNATLLRLHVDNVSKHGASKLARALRVNNSLQSLTIVTLDDLRFPDFGTQGTVDLALALVQNRNLTTLRFLGNLMEPPACEAMASLLSENRHIAFLELSGNHIGDVGALKLAPALKVNASLTKLIIRRNDIRVAGAAALIDAIRSSTSVINFQLFDRYLGDPTLAALGDLVRHDTKLQVLKFFSMYDITATGLEAFVRACSYNHTLRSLTICVAGMTHADIPWGVAVEQNQTLEKLDLQDCGLSATSLTELFNALLTNTSIRKLSVSGNDIAPETLECIIDLLLRHPTLEHLGIGIEGLSETDAQKIREACVQRQRPIHID